MYDFIQQIGTTSLLGFALIITVVFVIGCFFFWLLTRYILDIGSNRFLKWEYGIMCFVLAIYLAYNAYEYHWLFCVAVVVFILAPIISKALELTGSHIDANRCENCHLFITPRILKETEGLFRLGDYVPTGKKILLNSYSHQYIEKGELVTETISEYNYETRSNVSQDMTYLNQCPECNHKWESSGKKGRGNTRGPIRFVRITKRSIYWQERETEIEVTKDVYGREVDSREVSSRLVDHSRNGGGLEQSTHDVDNYRPYFHRYINGDRNAIDEYYDNYWGEVHLPL